MIDLAFDTVAFFRRACTPRAVGKGNFDVEKHVDKLRAASQLRRNDVRRTFPPIVLGDGTCNLLLLKRFVSLQLALLS